MNSAQPEAAPSLYELPNCIVCMDRLETDLAFLKCGHVYHEDCILNCFTTGNQSCPVCKKRVVSQKDIGKLFMEFQANTSTEQQIQKIVEQLGTEDASQSAFNKALAKLRIALQEQESLTLKFKSLQQDNKELKRREEDFLKGTKSMQDELKESVKQARTLRSQIDDIKMYASLLEGEKETQEVTIKKLEQELDEFRLYKSTEKIKGKDNNHYEDLRNEYLLTDPVEGLKYFCLLSEGLNLDIKNLQRSVSNHDDVLKEFEARTSRYRMEIEDYRRKFQKESEFSKTLREKYGKLLDKARTLKGQLNDRKIECSVVLDQSSNNTPWERKEKPSSMPSMLLKRPVMSEEEPKQEKNPFLSIGTGQRRLQKKSINNPGVTQLVMKP